MKPGPSSSRIRHHMEREDLLMVSNNPQTGEWGLLRPSDSRQAIRWLKSHEWPWVSALPRWVRLKCRLKELWAYKLVRQQYITDTDVCIRNRMWLKQKLQVWHWLYNFAARKQMRRVRKLSGWKYGEKTDARGLEKALWLCGREATGGNVVCSNLGDRTCT